MVFKFLQDLVNLVTICTMLDKSQKTEMPEKYSQFFFLRVKEGTKVKDFVFSQSNSSNCHLLFLVFFPLTYIFFQMEIWKLVPCF